MPLGHSQARSGILPHRSLTMAMGLCLLWAVPGFTQGAAPAATPGPPGPSEPTPIPAAEISDRAIATSAMLRSASADVAADQELQTIKEERSGSAARLESLRKETLRRLREEGPATLLQETRREWTQLEERLDRWLRALTSRADEVGALMKTVDGDKAVWEATRDGPAAADLPPGPRKTIQETLASIATVEQKLRAETDATLSLQAAVGQEKAEAEDMLAEQGREIDRRRRAVFRIDSVPLWGIFTQGAEEGSGGKAASAWADGWSALHDYVAETGPTLLRQLGILGLLVAALVALRRKAGGWAQADHSLDSTLALLDRPVAVALVLFIPVVRLMHPGAPAAWSGVLGLVLLAAALRLVPPVVHPSRRTWAYPLAALLLVSVVTRVAPDGGPLDRLAMLALSLLGALASAWIVRSVDRDASKGPSTWLRAIRMASRVTGGLFAVGALASVVGAVGLATYVNTGTLLSVFGALLLALVGLVLQGLVRIALVTGPAHRLGFVRSRAESVRAALFRLIRWSAVIAWGYAVLTGFLVAGPVLAFLQEILETERSIGKLSLSPADLLIFVVVVWLSFKLSQLIRFLLDTDVLPHMNLPRGAPAAIDTLTHYAVIVIGVMVAFSAAGFDVSRITIVFGALGVGIGFGLQNVVNNFVSGLILLFERPIKVGDVVQLEGTTGEVRSIAMRASIVRAYDGAEIIVPNSNLISAEVVNWTYRDEERRTHIPVGVAYGTDPGRVIELLTGVARAHPKVFETPEPVALFLGFGDSSLDFELRIWTLVGTWVQVASDLRVGITQALAEAGIEIPFPQRDVHVRSAVDDPPVTPALPEKGG